jgi:hypothetical protein
MAPVPFAITERLRGTASTDMGGGAAICPRYYLRYWRDMRRKSQIDLSLDSSDTLS